MDKVEKIAKSGAQLIDKGYQLQGCISDIAMTGQNRRDTEYLAKTLQEIRALGGSVQQMADELKPIVKRYNENEENLKKMRVELSKVKKENFTVKKKLEEWESDESFLSQDVLSEPGPSSPQEHNDPEAKEILSQDVPSSQEQQEENEPEAKKMKN